MTTTKQPGFAPAASPHASTAVHTSDEHITAGETSIPSQGENMPAYHARPKNADGPLPIVIVVQDQQRHDNDADSGKNFWFHYRGAGNFRRT